MKSTWDILFKCVWKGLVLLLVTNMCAEAGQRLLGAPQLRQRQNLALGICNRPLAISVCLESCMAENAREFAQMGLFASNLIKYFTNVQPNTIKMAINYCSSIQQWVDWTPSTEVFANYVMGMNQLYTFNMNNAFGAYGPFGVYGAYSPLQPAAGVCLEKARLAMAQLPPSYQPLVILFTSGRSSNPMYTIQQAQAVMLAGAEIFAVTEREPEMSEELRLSVSGPSYLLAVNDMNFLGRAEIDAIIMNVCKIERFAGSPVFPVNVVGNLQRPRDQMNLPLLLAQQSGQITTTTISSLNTTTMNGNNTATDVGSSVSNTTGLGNNSTTSTSDNSSSSSNGMDNVLLLQQLNNSESLSMRQNVTGVLRESPVNTLSALILPAEDNAMESSGNTLPVTTSGDARSASVITNRTFESLRTENMSSSLRENNFTQSTTPAFEKTSFSTLELETTSFSKPESSSVGNRTLTLESSTFGNITFGPFGSSSIADGTLAFDNNTFKLLPLATDSEDTSLNNTNQSVLNFTHSIQTEEVRDIKNSTGRPSGASETNRMFLSNSSTHTASFETDSMGNTRAQTSATDNPKFNEQQPVTLSPETSSSSSTANKVQDVPRAEVLSLSNFPTRHDLRDVLQMNNAFNDDRLVMNKHEDDSSVNQDESVNQPRLEFMGDECIGLEGITDPVVRSKMLKERPDCASNETKLPNTQEMPCVDLSSIISPLVQLNILLANIPRQPCADNTTKNRLTSAASPEIAPTTNMNDSTLEGSKIVLPVMPEKRLCIDLNNVFDIYRLGLMLANLSDHSVHENNISVSLKTVQAESFSASEVNLQSKDLSLEQFALLDRIEKFQEIAEAFDKSLTSAVLTSSPFEALTENFTATTYDSPEAGNDTAINRSLSKNSSVIVSTKDHEEGFLSIPVSCVNISVLSNPIIRKALQTARSLRPPCIESDNMIHTRNPSAVDNHRRISRELGSNNRIDIIHSTVSPLEAESTDFTTISVRTESSSETSTFTAKLLTETAPVFKDSLQSTNMVCIDISSAPHNTRSIIIELIKPLNPCLIQSDSVDELDNSIPPHSSTELERISSCSELDMLPPFIKLLVNIFPILSPCEKRNKIKRTNREIIFESLSKITSVPKFSGDVTVARDTSIDRQQASNTRETPCVDISILPESDRQLAIDFFQLYKILTCNNPNAFISISAQAVNSCVNTTMFSEKERTTITIFFSIYGIQPCSASRNCLEFTLLPPELLSKYPEVYGPVNLCNIEASEASAERSTTPPTSDTTHELCSDPSIVGDLGLIASTSNCYSFVICSGRTPEGNWTQHNLVPCPPQLFWSQEKLSCVPAEGSSCVTGLCSSGAANLKMASVIFPECPEYLQCNSGRITRHCCPEGHVFHEGVCRAGINLGCPNSCENAHNDGDVAIQDPR